MFFFLPWFNPPKTIVCASASSVAVTFDNVFFSPNFRVHYIVFQIHFKFHNPVWWKRICMLMLRIVRSFAVNRVFLMCSRRTAVCVFVIISTMLYFFFLFSCVHLLATMFYVEFLCVWHIFVGHTRCSCVYWDLCCATTHKHYFTQSHNIWFFV